MHLRLVTAPSSEPVSLETVKAYLRVDQNVEDALIVSLAKAAREAGEVLARRAFVTQTWEMILDAFPADLQLHVYRPPLQSVTFIKYLNQSNVEQTWTDYVVDPRSEPGVILFTTLPNETLLASGAITVRFVAGYGTDTAVPERFKNLILALTGYWYENRETHDVPGDIKRAFIAERAVWF